MRRFSGRPLRVTDGRKGAFNHVSLFCSRHPPWWGTYVQQILDKCKRRSWTNTKRLLKKISEFTDSQVGWRRLVFGNLIHHCLSESLIGNSKTVTSNGIRFCVQVCHFVTDNRIYFPFVRGCVFLISFMVLFKDNTYIDFGKPDRLHFLSTMKYHSFCERGNSTPSKAIKASKFLRQWMRGE